MLPSIPPTMSEDELKKRFVMKEFGINPLDDAMIRFLDLTQVDSQKCLVGKRQIKYVNQ